MVDTGLLTVVVGVLGIFLGTMLSPYLNHRLNQKYNREDIFFRKKLEYFEKITESMESNIRLYHASVHKLENISKKDEISKIVGGLREERKKFLIMSSPIFLNSNKLAKDIESFTKTEKDIFITFKRLLNKEIHKDAAEIDLKEKFINLRKIANNILTAMKKELM